MTNFDNSEFYAFTKIAGFDPIIALIEGLNTNTDANSSTNSIKDADIQNTIKSNENDNTIDNNTNITDQDTENTYTNPLEIKEKENTEEKSMTKYVVKGAGIVGAFSAITAGLVAFFTRKKKDDEQK